MKKRLIILSALMVLLILATSCSLFQKTEDTLFNDGLELLGSGNYYGAIEFFEQIDSLYPKSPYGYYGRAIAFQKDRREIDALNEYLRIQTKDTEFIPGLKALISLAAKSGRPNLALDISTQYRAVETDSSAKTVLNAELLLDIGEFGLARGEMAKITSGTPSNTQQHLFYSKLFLHDGDFEKAIEQCALAVAGTENSVETLTEAGSIYASLSLFDSAATYYNKALTSASIDYYQKAIIAESFLEMNYVADAFKIVAELEQKVFQNNVIPFLKAKLLLLDGQALWAKNYYTRTIAQNKMTPAQQLTMAEVKWASKDIQGTIMALEHANQIAEAESYHLGLRNEITLKKPELFVGNLDWRSADGILRPLEGLLPLDFNTIFLKAGIYLMAGRKELLDPALIRLEILVEDNPYRLAKVADLFLLADSLEMADNYYDLALVNDKVNIASILGKVKILNKKKRYKEAIAYLEKQNQYILSNNLIYPELVSLYKKQGELKKARNFVNNIIGDASGDIDRYILAMELAREDNSPNDVEPIVKTCLENNPDNGLAMILAGEYYMTTSSNDEAEKFLQSAVATGIKSYDAYYRLGLLLTDKGEVASALSYFEKSIEVNQFYSKAYGHIAQIMIDEENIDPKTLGQIMNYIRQAQRGEKNPEDFISMGRALVIQKRYKAANKNFHKALQIDPKNPEYNYYGGLNYINLDSTKKAKTYLSKAIKNGLSDKLKSSAQNALGNL